jgi:tetratricopeptide (TPR) repeat protein
MSESHSAPSRESFALPPAPATEIAPVKIWSAPVSIPTYLPAPADPLPIFLENRVYQGSSGKVYPLPVIDRIASEPVPHTWQAVHLENEFLRVMVLPEIGGRIHIGLDKTNGYDFFYRQNAIKPALVGLAGPWISGGVEFNWPQHHRPATFMPCETALERHADGSATIWCSQHDPISHMKGMHGVCLHPGKALIELKARLDNRTEEVQTFLWWANVATRVHERYQSFFPPDVRFVADHAKRAITSFPRSDRPYYGVDYPARAAHGVPEEERPANFIPDGSYLPDDLSWYANIPVPTSYMITATADDFFGGYDHAAEAGVVHVANHHIAPGKKQWTWGNHEFGYNWDRCLTDNDGPYIELMAGVYTDNQPDFSFLAPGETKTFSQYWYPIRKIGVPQAANLQAAMSLRFKHARVHMGVSVTTDIPNAHLALYSSQRGLIAEWTQTITAAEPFLVTYDLPPIRRNSISLVLTQNGIQILRYAPAEIIPAPAPEAATEPPPPEEIRSNDELYLTGLHLQQYRHATRHPELYWREALRRDPGDSRCNAALGTWHLKRGEFAQAEQHLRAAIARLTHRNPNPYDGEPHYQLGLTLRHQRRYDEAYAAFYKSTWNAAWRAPAYQALAELDARKSDWPAALDHITRSLRVNADNLNAQSLRGIALLHLGREREAHAQLSEALALDPVHPFARHLLTAALPPSGQDRLDLAFDYARCGLLAEAVAVLAAPVPTTENDGSAPMRHYARAVFLAELGNATASAAAYAEAAALPAAYVFPNRLEEIYLLETAIASNPTDARALLYLGNLLYDRRRHTDAIARWERSAALGPTLAVTHRNLAIAYFNINHDPAAALAAFDRAVAADPNSARLLYERDQLWKRTGVAPATRLAELLRRAALLNQRDDLAVELATLLNHTGQPRRALDLILARQFQPWEGGEGLVLAQFVRASILLAQTALANGDAPHARSLLTAALTPPHSLGESNHLLVNRSELLYWLGVATAADGDLAEANRLWQRGARISTDFQQMAVAEVSANTFWVASCLDALGDHEAAAALLTKIQTFARPLEHQRPVIDYFATSLPTMLLFDDDLALRNRIQSMYLSAQAALSLGQPAEAEALVREVLQLDPSHSGAHDLIQGQRFTGRYAGMPPQTA